VALVAASLPAQAAVPKAKAPRQVTSLVDFGKTPASRDVAMTAQWVRTTGDNQGAPFVIVDKKAAKVFVFSPNGKLRGATPVLLGLARGDHTVPGIGDKPLSQIRDDERTTPAGRFVAEPGVNTKGDDIVWVDYEAAVSMHRVRAMSAAERRLERLASRTPNDNRISYGCINVPVAFYNKVLSPAAQESAVIYVLPETQPASALFGFRDPSEDRRTHASAKRPAPIQLVHLNGA
jgi:hypothetical protein